MEQNPVNETNSSNYHHKQNRFYLGKTDLICHQLKLGNMVRMNNKVKNISPPSLFFTASTSLLHFPLLYVPLPSSNAGRWGMEVVVSL